MMFKRQLSILTLAMAAAMPLCVVTSAVAQTQGHRAAPVIETLGVEQLQAIRPGGELAFELKGTPGATVTLQVAGATGEVRLTEARPGHYEGHYTVRSRDRITALSTVIASMAKDGQIARATMKQSLLRGARDIPTAADHITAFTVDAPERVRPGDEIGFKMSGVAGGKARVVVDGLPRDIALKEVRPGQYEGNYVLRRKDKLRGDLVATGYLMSNRAETSQRYDRQHPVVGQAARDDRAVACATCGRVVSVNQVEVKGDSKNVVGTIAGGVIGGVLGNQVGGGTGKDVARVLGAIGGAYAGNRIENNMDKSSVYRVVVRMEGGADQTFDYADDPVVSVGTRVKVDNGQLIRL